MLSSCALLPHAKGSVCQKDLQRVLVAQDLGGSESGIPQPSKPFTTKNIFSTWLEAYGAGDIFTYVGTISFVKVGRSPNPKTDPTLPAPETFQQVHIPAGTWQLYLRSGSANVRLVACPAA